MAAAMSEPHDSSDDLDITNTVRKHLDLDKAFHSKRSLKEPFQLCVLTLLDVIDASFDSDTQTEQEQEGSQGGRAVRSMAGGRVEWSDSDNDGGAAYAKFKTRKSLKRKRAIASTKNAKDIAALQDGASRPKTTRKKKREGERPKQDEEDPEAVDEEMPSYIKARKLNFEENRKHLKVEGLKLPPNFEEVVLSDDEGHRIKTLKERPQFAGGPSPCAAYEDIKLPYSLGLIPAPIAQWLRDYQVKGTAFLHHLFVYQKGGILGDDMGLGKTVQVIAFLTAAFGKTGDERDAKRMRKMRRAPSKPWYPRVLVVCPGTLIENWKAEFNRWGWWHIDKCHGESKESAIDTARAGQLEVMITTYATYRLNKDVINMVEWDCVIADECHQLKERTSEITKAMNDVNSLCRIGLTGTAIQNKYEELWTLLNWTNPGRFGPIAIWKASISEPLRIGQSHDATVYELSKARKTAKRLVENLLPDFFLRRMKSLIADQLPKKSDKVVFCPLTPTQRNAYELFLDSEVVQMIRTSTESCLCGSSKKKGWCCHMLTSRGRKWQEFVFPAISNLQKIANHLAIIIPQGNDPKDKQEKDLELLETAMPDQWKELWRNRDSIINLSNPEFCGKWKILKKLLTFWHANGDKVLVFSHSVRLLRMLQMLFNHTSYNVSYLDGGMTYEDRAHTVDDFNSDPSQFVFLISTKAGGVGLNITSANKVVIVDPNWNPSYDLQAQDRAYRIGQIRDVEVFRLVSAGTIEEIVYARQIYKQQQANIGYNASSERRYFKGVQEKSDQKGEIFGLTNLFSYQADDVLLKEIVNKTNVAEAKAGVEVVGLELDHDSSGDDGDDDDDDDDDILQGDEEDSAMSQLAAFVRDEGLPEDKRKKKRKRATTKKTDAVQAILAQAGVEYTHENSEVVGSSRVETHLSRRAEEAGNDLDLAGSYVFGHGSDSDTDSDDVDDDDLGNAPNGMAGRAPSKIKYVYHPPQAVKERQFCSMARTFGFSDAIEFATVVEGWTQKQRRSCLERFYKARREALLGASGPGRYIRGTDIP